LDVDVARQTIAKIAFITMEAQTGLISYVSESYRAYAENRLQGIKTVINELVIDNLLKRPNDEVALRTLPVHLSNAGRNEELNKYFSAERIKQILKSNETRLPNRKRAELAIKSANALKKDGELLRLSTLRSTLGE